MPKAKKLPSGSWRCQVYDYTTPEGKIIRKSFTVSDPSAAGRRKCEAMAAEWAAKKEHTKTSGQTLEQATRRYIASREHILSPTTLNSYRQILKQFGALLEKPLAAITNDDAQALINMTARTHSPKTVRNVYGLFNAVIREYRQDISLRVKMPEKRPPARYVPNETEAKAIINAVRGTVLELPVLLAAYGPMRRGEICALRMDNIKGNVVHVCENMVKDLSGGRVKWIIKAPKSAAGDRFIEYPEQVAALWEGKEGRVINMNPDTLTNEFRRLLIRKKLPPVRFHDLRHYSASIMHALNIPNQYIMERGGWSDDRTLVSIYRHTLSEQTKEMADKINNYFTRTSHE